MRSRLLPAALGLLALLLSGCSPRDGMLEPAEASLRLMAQAGEGREIAAGLYQLTGTHLRRGQTRHGALPELPDPAPPYVTPAGEVEIYGTAGYFIRYASWAEFSRGGTFQVVPLDVRYPNGYAPPTPHDFPWDLRKYRIEAPDEPAREVLIGGSMSPSSGRALPLWPGDNAGRRLYLFHPDTLHRWVRDADPIVGAVATGWVGHSYGGNLLQVGTTDPGIVRLQGGDVYLFYERVTENASAPFRTEIFARKMVGLAGVSDEEIPILRMANPPYPATHRGGDSYLMEGPRPVQMRIEGEDFFVVAFSAGDYRTDGYTISYAWSRSVTGPYQLALTPDGSDILDLGAPLEARLALGWVGRPAIYPTPEGGYEVLFHGVTKSILPDNDYRSPPTRYPSEQFFRSVFKARLATGLAEDGSPRLEIVLPD